MATKDLLVRVLGDTRDVEAAFARSSRAANQFGASVDTTGKKADRAARNVSGFAKGALAGFGGAIAFTEGIRALRSVIDAASESQQVLGQTRVALESTGQSWQTYGDKIEDAIAAQSRLGFDDEALLRTFSLFVRQSRDVGEALRRNSIAMNVARARFIDLEQAANLVNKAALGQAGALRRVGIDARNGASGVELLTQLEKQFAGAAEDASNSAVGATDRFKVSIENVQESLGALLLPKIVQLADNTALAADRTTQLVAALRKLGQVKIPPIKIPLILDTGAGGTDLGAIFGKAKDAAVAGFETQFPGLKFVNDLVQLFQTAPIPDTKAAADAFDAKFDTFLESLGKDLDGSTKRANAKLKAFGEKGFKPLEANELGEKLQTQFEGVLEALDLQFDQAEFAGNTQAALAILDKTEAAIRQRIATQGRTTDLLRQLFDVDRQRTALLKQGKEAAQAAAQEARDLAKEQARAAAEAMKALTQRNQFRALGLSASGEEIIPGIKNLSTRIDGALKRIGSGEIDVSSKLVDRLKLARKLIRQEGSKLTAETRDTINELIKTVTQGAQKADKQTGPLTKTIGLNTRKLLDGLALSPDAERELRQRLSGFNSAGIARAGATNRPTGGFVGPGNQPIIVNTTVTLDDQIVGRSVTRTQQKDRRRNPKAKRGPRSGI